MSKRHGAGFVCQNCWKNATRGRGVVGKEEPKEEGIVPHSSVEKKLAAEEAKPT